MTRCITSINACSGDLPSRISFFEALDIPSVDDVDPSELWRIDSPETLLRTPLGPTAGGAGGGELLWLDLKDDYWDKQGRKSIDAVVLFGGLLTIGVAGKSALQELGLLPKLISKQA